MALSLVIPSCSHTGQVLINFSKMLMFGLSSFWVLLAGAGGIGGFIICGGGGLGRGGDEGFESGLGGALGRAVDEIFDDGIADGCCAGSGGQIGLGTCGDVGFWIGGTVGLEICGGRGELVCVFPVE